MYSFIHSKPESSIIAPRLASDRARQLRKDASLYLDNGVFPALQALNHEINSVQSLEVLSAGENVYRCVAVLRPRVDAQMGFCNGNYARDSLGAELVERLVYNCGPGLSGCLQK